MSRESFKNLRTNVWDIDPDTMKLAPAERTIVFKGFESESNGKVITKKAAQHFVKKYWNSEKTQDPNETISVIFNKRILTLLLAQKDCEGIRFYFANNNDGELTLVLVGVNSEDYDLGANYLTTRKYKTIILDDSNLYSDKEDTIIVEVGGGNKRNQFMDKDGKY